MPSVSETLAATVTAVLYMTLCVGSQANSINAPVALLLPNGTIIMVPDRNNYNAIETSKKLNQHSRLLDVTRSHGGPQQGNTLVDQRMIKQPRAQLSYPNEIGLDANGLQLISTKNWIKDPCNCKPQDTTVNIDGSKRTPEENSRRNTWGLISNAGLSKFDRLTKLNRANKVQIREFHKSAGGPYHNVATDEMCCTCDRPKAPECDGSININNEQVDSKDSTRLTMPMPFKMHNKDISGKLCSFENISEEISEPNKSENLNIMNKRQSKNILEQIKRLDVSTDNIQSFPTLGDEEAITFKHNRPEYSGFVEKKESRGYTEHRIPNLEDPEVYPITVPKNVFQDSVPRCRATNAGLRLISNENGNQRGTFKEAECYCDSTDRNLNAENAESNVFGTSGTKTDEVCFYRQPVEAGSARDLKDKYRQSEEFQTAPHAQASFRNRDHFAQGNGYAKRQRFRNAKVPEVNSPDQTLEGLRGYRVPTDVSEENNWMLANERPQRVDVESQVNDVVINKPRAGGSSENGYHYNCFGAPHWENNSARMEGTIVSNFPMNGNSMMCKQQPGHKSFIGVTPGYHPGFARTAGFTNILPYLRQNTNHLGGLGSYESFAGAPKLLNRNDECPGLETSPVFGVPANSDVFSIPSQSNSPACLTNSAVHKLPWMPSPIHHPPMATRNQRCSSFLPGDFLSSDFPSGDFPSGGFLYPALSSITSFAKDQYDNWWFIHYEIDV